MRSVNFAIGEILRPTRKKGDAWRKPCADETRLQISQPATGGSVTSFLPSATLLLALVALSLPAEVRAQRAQAPDDTKPRNELDAFMEKVLAQREANRQTLRQYILDEAEEFEVLGPGRFPLYRTKREFTWYRRDGVHVRSPLRFDGVKVTDEERDRYEKKWLSRELNRQDEREKRRKEREITVGPQGVEVVSPRMPAEPRFVSEAYFMDFKFEPGNYYLAGREKLEGKDVLKIEYYPTGMFGDDDERDRGDKEADREKTGKKAQDNNANKGRDSAQAKEFERNIERRMNKTALITLWVALAEHQIVKYTFDNVWLDFLPGAWLVRVDDLRASMTMGQPFPGIWLPREMNIHAGVTLANGSFEAGYGRAFSEYREADVKSRIRVPKEKVLHDGFFPAGSPRRVLHVGFRTTGSSRQLPAAVETVGEIRVHGNAYLTDQDVIRLAGVAVGKPLDAAEIEAIRKRLEDSGRFDTVEVRKRYRSLTDTTNVAVVLLVHERPGVRSIDDGTSAVLNPIRRVKSRLMFLPIITYADGYGFTYGGRVSTVDLLGIGERLSVPLTWGGTRRAALEFERPFKRGPLTRIESSVAIWNRENPRFEIRDQRVELKGRAERVFADIVRLGVEGSRATVSFADLDDRLTTFGGNVALDTRGDPAFPGNAILLSAGWTAMNFRSLPTRVNRYASDGRGYLRLYRQLVVAARAQYVAADQTLPPYERLLLGGSATVRGFGTGSFDGDRSLVTSLEFRTPITSVLSGAKLGVTAFMDAGKIWNFGQSLDDATWRQGVGGGVFLIAPLMRINLDVAYGLKTGKTRLHVSSGFTF
jgi:hypothetical protein